MAELSGTATAHDCCAPAQQASCCEPSEKGAGADVLISAQRVGPTGKAIGLDMTDEMLDLARRNAEQAGASNVDRAVRARPHRRWACLSADQRDPRVHQHAAAAIIRALKP